MVGDDNLVTETAGSSRHWYRITFSPWKQQQIGWLKAFYAFESTLVCEKEYHCHLRRKQQMNSFLNSLVLLKVFWLLFLLFCFFCFKKIISLLILHHSYVRMSSCQLIWLTIPNQICFIWRLTYYLILLLIIIFLFFIKITIILEILLK